MPQNAKPKAVDLLDRDFLTFRSMLLDLAAFLDRIDRYEGSAAAREDFRYRAFMEAFRRAGSALGNRTDEILIHFSDPTREPVEDVVPPGKAAGAWSSR